MPFYFLIFLDSVKAGFSKCSSQMFGKNIVGHWPKHLYAHTHYNMKSHSVSEGISVFSTSGLKPIPASIWSQYWPNCGRSWLETASCPIDGTWTQTHQGIIVSQFEIRQVRLIPSGLNFSKNDLEHWACCGEQTLEVPLSFIELWVDKIWHVKLPDMLSGLI